MESSSASWLRSAAPTSENVDDSKPFTWRDGFRIVDLNELAKQMRCKRCASLLDLNDTQNETRFGLASVLSVECSCGTLNDVCTGKIQRMNEGKAMFEVNIKASINMLLYGVGAQHVINFLAVLDIPLPMSDDTSLLIPSSPDITSVLLPSSNNVAVAPQSPSTSNDPPRPQNQGAYCDSAATSSSKDSKLLLTPPVEVKADRVQVVKVGDDSDSQSRSPDTPTGTKGKLSSSCPKRNQKIRSSHTAAEEEKEFVPSAAKLEETEDAESGLLDISFEVAGTLAAVHTPAGRKYYKCPLCPRVLPSSRGFNIHVGRKHQVSNYQAEHYELGPNAGYTGNKAQDAIGENAACTQLSAACHNRAHFTQRAAHAPLAMEEDSETKTDRLHAVPSTSQQLEKTGEGEREDPGVNCTEATPTCSVSESGPDSFTRSGRRLSGRGTGTFGAAGSRFTCRIRNCRKEFRAESAYKKHLRRVHNVDSAIVCGLCGQEYDSQMNLKKHTTIAHRTKEEKRVGCRYCGETLPHGGALKRHIKANHPRGSKMTYYCDQCPQTFTRPCELKNHKQRHAGIKNYKCFYCDMSFAGAGNRLSHIRYIHQKERKFLCDTCGASFHRAHTLREHERVHSGEKPFQCERCAERFTKKEYLIIHMRTHTGERPYKCELCGKAFTQRCSRSLHRRKVHGAPKQDKCYGSKLTAVQVENKILYVKT